MHASTRQLAFLLITANVLLLCGVAAIAIQSSGQPINIDLHLNRGVVLAGGVAGFIAFVQLAQLFTLPPLIQFRAKRWTIGYVLLSGFVAGGTYYLSRNHASVRSLGDWGAVIVGLFYPAIVFRMTGSVEAVTGQSNEARIQNLHEGIFGIFANGIRRNNLRHWFRISQILDSLDVQELRGILRNVVSAPNVLKDDEERRSILARLNTSGGTSKPGVVTEPQPAEDTLPHQEEQADADTNGAETVEQRDAGISFYPLTKSQLIEWFHQLRAPELIVDQLMPEREAMWFLATLPLQELIFRARKLPLSASDFRLLDEVGSREVLVSSMTMDDARDVVLDIIRANATLTYLDDIVCEFRQRSRRCWLRDIKRFLKLEPDYRTTIDEYEPRVSQNQST